MQNINLTPIIQAFLALLAALITYRLIPWIHERTTAAQQGNLRAAVKVLVFAAEQLYGAGNGKEKLHYVRERLLEQGYEVDVNEIEGAVAEYLNRGMELSGEVEGEAETDNVELPPLEEWPLEMIVDFCRLNGIPHGGCETKEDYINAIVRTGKAADDDAEEPESTPEAEG